MSRVTQELLANNRIREAAELLGSVGVSVGDVASGESVPVKLVVKKTAKKRTKAKAKKRA